MDRPLPTPPDTPDLHGFVTVGDKALYLCHLPMFYVENHCYQVILRAELAPEDHQTYLRVQAENPQSAIILGNHTEHTLRELVEQGGFLADAFVGMPTENSEPFMTPMVRITRVLRFVHFDPKAVYPSHLTYFLFGTDGEAHISHHITKAPNFQQIVSLAAVPSGVTPSELERMLSIRLPDVPEGGPIEHDPLTESRYRAVTDEGRFIEIAIGRKHWFDVEMLNEIPDDDAGHGLHLRA